MKFEKTIVFNFKGALRGMRNPMNSWDKSDSNCVEGRRCSICPDNQKCDFYFSERGTGKVYRHEYYIGQNDLKLAQNLIKAGTEHCKFMRQIMLSVDITAPLYWWKEFDTYKVGTTANSTSTMHKLSTTPIRLDCFEIDDYGRDLVIKGSDDKLYNIDCISHEMINFLERLRLKYVETKDVRYWKELIRWLPESWLQTRTITMNYENVRNMYWQRKNHKLSEWSKSFIEWVESLPYAKELIMLDAN